MTEYTVGQQISKADLEALWAFPIGATAVDGKIIDVIRYGAHTAIVVSVPGSGMAGEKTSLIIR